MNDDDKSLLNDVLGEAAPMDFREALLEGTLRLARRRRRWRQSRRTAVVLAVLGLCGILIWQGRPARTLAPPAQAAGQSYGLVRTQPLSSSAVVATKPLAAGRLVASSQAVGIVHTSVGNFRVLDDAELLALLGPRPAVLIRTGPHSEELVFANPEDANGFPLN